MLLAVCGISAANAGLLVSGDATFSVSEDAVLGMMDGDGQAPSPTIDSRKTNDLRVSSTPSTSVSPHLAISAHCLWLTDQTQVQLLRLDDAALPLAPFLESPLKPA